MIRKCPKLQMIALMNYFLWPLQLLNDFVHTFTQFFSLVRSRSRKNLGEPHGNTLLQSNRLLSRKFGGWSNQTAFKKGWRNITGGNMILSDHEKLPWRAPSWISMPPGSIGVRFPGNCSNPWVIDLRIAPGDIFKGSRYLFYLQRAFPIYEYTCFTPWPMIFGVWSW